MRIALILLCSLFVGPPAAAFDLAPFGVANLPAPDVLRLDIVDIATPAKVEPNALPDLASAEMVTAQADLDQPAPTMSSADTSPTTAPEALLEVDANVAKLLDANEVRVEVDPCDPRKRVEDGAMVIESDEVAGRVRGSVRTRRAGAAQRGAVAPRPGIGLSTLRAGLALVLARGTSSPSTQRHPS